MSRKPLRQARPRTKVLSIMWFLASVLVFFTVENIWLDPWLRNMFPHLPTLVPEPLSGLWFLAFVLVAIFCVLLLVAEILVALDRGIPLRMKVGTGMATLFALLLCAMWFQSTSGVFSAASLRKSTHAHSVTLSWRASSSAVAGYNIYRSEKPGGPFTKINAELVRTLTYKDQEVESGKTYYYVTRAVDAKGRESVNSDETTATVP
jgi:hypothetical protein